MTKIFVCGGNGFIGSNFIRYWLNQYQSFLIINFDNLTDWGCRLTDIWFDEKHYPNYIFGKGDITDISQLEYSFSYFKPDFVVNFAAETHVDKSIYGKRDVFLQSNYIGVFNILEMIKKYGGVQKYVQVSTDEVYGDLPLKSQDKFNENSLIKPSNVYSATKAAADLLCLSYYRTFGVPVVITRCGNNFGPYQHPEKLIPFFILKMLKNEKLPVYGDGKNIRDWVWVGDHIKAIEKCLLFGRCGEIYNVSANNERTNLEIVKIILEYFNRDESWIEFVKDRPGHDRRYALDSTKIRKELKWLPQIDKDKFKDKLIEVIQWYCDNQRWLYFISKKEKINPHIKK